MAEHLITQVSEEDEQVQAVGISPGNQDEERRRSSKCWNILACCLPCLKPKKSIVSKTSPSLKQGQSSLPSTPSQVAIKALPVNQSHGGQVIPVEMSPSVPGNLSRKFLLPSLSMEQRGKKTLVLDLDETLVHSSFKPIPNADFVISIELDNVIHRVYVRKRPGVDHFMKVVGEKFEVVVFTASLAKYADPLLDILDRHKVVATRLFREACVQHYGNYVKDLSHLGRPLEHIIIIDNSPYSYMFQPHNAIPITSWFHDKNDRQLYDLLPLLESIMEVDDVCVALAQKRLAWLTQTQQTHLLVQEQVQEEN